MKRNPASRSRFLLNPFLRALLPLMTMPGLALATPTGGVVVGGDAAISQPDIVTTVIDQSSAAAAINWQSFNVGGNEFVVFNQPSASSVVLNRVVGGDPSAILGQLSANGRVFLVNPAGVLFGQSATVDVGGLVASTLDISVEDFFSGNYVFARAVGHGGRVENAGHISAADGGFVVLAGAEVRNSGLIQGRLGTVALTSGSSLTLDFDGSGLVGYEITQGTLAEAAGVSNVGEILAQGGRVVMAAHLARELIGTVVNNQGVIRAQGMAEEDGGGIVLTATGGDILQSGTLDVSAGSGQAAGSIDIFSDRDITLTAGSTIDATGASAGEVRVIAEQALSYEAGAFIDIARESDQGLGGFAELSGRQEISIEGHVDLGDGGTLVLDPGGDFAIGGPVKALRDISENSLETILREASSSSIVSVVGASSVTLLDLEDGVLDGTSIEPGFGAGLLLGVGTTTRPDPRPSTEGVYTRGAVGSIRFVDPNDAIRVGGALIINTGTDAGTVNIGALDARSIFIDSANDIITGNLVSAGAVDLVALDGQIRAGDISITGAGDLALSSRNADFADDLNGGFVSGITLGDLSIAGAITLETRDVDLAGAGLAVAGPGITARDISAADSLTVSSSSDIRLDTIQASRVNLTATGQLSLTATALSLTGDISIDVGAGNLDFTDLRSEAGAILLRAATGSIEADTLSAGGELRVAAGQGDLSLVSASAGNGMSLSTADGQVSVGTLNVSGGGLIVSSSNADVSDDASGGSVSGIVLGDLNVPGVVLLSTFENDRGSSGVAGQGRGITTGDVSARQVLHVNTGGDFFSSTGDIRLGSVRLSDAAGDPNAFRINAQGGSINTGGIRVLDAIESNGLRTGITLGGRDGITIDGGLSLSDADGGDVSLRSFSGNVNVAGTINLAGNLSVSAGGDVSLNQLRNLTGLNLAVVGWLNLASTDALTVAGDLSIEVGQGDLKFTDLGSGSGSIFLTAQAGSINVDRLSAATNLNVFAGQGNLSLLSARAGDGISLITGNGQISVETLTLTGGDLTVMSINADVGDDAGGGFVSGITFGDLNVPGAISLTTSENQPHFSPGAIGLGQGITTGDISAQGQVAVSVGGTSGLSRGDIDLGAIQIGGSFVGFNTLQINAETGSVNTGSIAITDQSSGNGRQTGIVLNSRGNVTIGGGLTIVDSDGSEASLFSSTGDVSVDGPVDVSDFSVHAGRNLTLAGLNVSGATHLQVEGNLSVNQASGDLLIDTLSAGGANLVAADGRIEVVNFSAGDGNVMLNSTNADVADDASGGNLSGIRIGDLSTGGDIDLRTQNLDPRAVGLSGLSEGISTGNLSAGGSLAAVTQAGDLSLGTVSAGDALRLDSAGSLNLTDPSIDVAGSIDVAVTTGNLTLDQVAGSGVTLLARNGQVDVQSVDARAGNLTVLSVNADLTDEATGPVSGIRLGKVADVGGSISLSTVDVGLGSGASGLGIFVGSDLSAGGSLSVSAFSSDVQLGGLSSGGDVGILAQAGSVSLSDPRLFAAGTVGVSAATGDLEFTTVAGSAVALFTDDGQIRVGELIAGAGGTALNSNNADLADDVAGGPVSGISVGNITSGGSVSLVADDNAPGLPDSEAATPRASGGPSGNIMAGDIRVIADPAQEGDGLGSIRVAASGLLTLNNSDVAGGQITLAAGDIRLTNASITGGPVQFALQGPDADLNDGGTRSTIVADSLLVSGARNILLGASDLNAGSGLTPAGTGDAVLLAELARRGLAPGVSVRPNAALLASNTLSLGSLALGGDHLLLQGNTVSLGDDGLTAAGGLLLQFLPGDSDALVSLENLRAQIGEVNFGARDDFPPPAGDERSVVVIGGSAFDGDILVGQNGRVVPPPGTDLVLFTSGNVTEFRRTSRDNGEVVIIGNVVRPPPRPEENEVSAQQSQIPPPVPRPVPVLDLGLTEEELIEQHTAETGVDWVCR